MSLPDFIPPVVALPAVGSTNPADMVRMTAIAQHAEAQEATGANFGQLVTQGIEQVNATLLDGQIDMQRLAAGEVDHLHHVMLKMEQSRLSFQLMLQVRNRLLESYQDVMRMQV